MKKNCLIVLTFLFAGFCTELFGQRPDTIPLLDEKEYKIEFISNTLHSILKWKGEKPFSYDFGEIVGHYNSPPNVTNVKIDSTNILVLLEIHFEDAGTGVDVLHLYRFNTQQQIIEKACLFQEIGIYFFGIEYQASIFDKKYSIDPITKAFVVEEYYAPPIKSESNDPKLRNYIVRRRECDVFLEQKKP